MKFSINYIALVFGIFQVIIPKAHSAIFLDNTVKCSDIVGTTSDGTTSFEVCAYGTYSSPSPVQDENGTITYIGGYTNTYTIVKPDILMEGDEYMGTEDEKAGIEIIISRDDNEVCTGITVTLTYPEETTSSISITPCNSCTYCGNDTYSYDCTNLVYGRMTRICELATSDSILFPLTSDAFPVLIPSASPISPSDNGNDNENEPNDTLSIIWGWISKLWDSIVG